jgi:hypothetical protein
MDGLTLVSAAAYYVVRYPDVLAVLCMTGGAWLLLRGRNA